MAIVLALLAALSYGLSDFLGGVVSRRTSAWSVAFVGALSSLAFAVVTAPFFDGSPRASDFAWAAAAGLGSGTGVGFLYRGFSQGRMSAVAPVSAVGAAIVPVAFGVVGGERPALLAWVGIAVALPAIWLVSSTPTEPLDDAPVTSGMVDGVLAGLGFGLLFACIGQVPSTSGMWPLATAQLVSIPAVTVLAATLGGAWRPRGRLVWWALLCGPFGGAANLLFLLATQRGFLTVSSVLTALYPASTVVLALVVLHERVHRAQVVGLALCAVTVALVTAG